MHERPELAVGQRLAGVGIDDLHDEGVLEDVQAIVRRALDRDPLHLVEAVGVVVLDAEGGLEQLAVADVGERGELEVGGGVVAQLAGHVGEPEEVVAGGEDGGGPVLDGQLHLASRCS